MAARARRRRADRLVNAMILGIAAFLGAPGAFSHEAVVLYAPGHEPTPCETFEDAFAAVRSGVCTIAVLPVHNVTAGAVEEVAQRLPAAGLREISRHDMVIRQNLMSLPGVNLADIAEVPHPPDGHRSVAASS